MLSFRYIGNRTMKKKATDKVSFSRFEIANFFREMQLTLNIARGIKDQHIIDAVLPDTLRVCNPSRASIEDCNAFIDVLRELMAYTEENKQQLATYEEDLSKLMRTSISVSNGDVTVATSHNGFDKHIRIFCASKKYRL